ncbi:MAG: siderophore-interacting protein [Dietzia sp.]
MSRPDLLIHPLVVRTAVVTDVQTLPGRVRRVRLGGEQLRPFTRDGLEHPGFAAPGFDDHVKIILAADGDVAAALPRQHPDGIEWTPSVHRLTRDYTPHDVDPVTGAFSIDFVLHGDGPAARWATAAEPGDTLSFAGPKSSMVLPDDVTAIVLLGDDTAIPAIRRFLTEVTVPVPVHVAVVVGDDAPRDLPAGSATSVTLERPGVAGADTYAALFDRISAAEDLGDRPFVWAAGESRALLALRRRIGPTVGRGHRSITGYWHTDEDAAGSPGPALPGLPVGWFMVRAALELGLFEAVRGGALSAAELGERIGAVGELGPLLGGLASLALLEPGSDGRWALSGAAEDLLDDPHAREEFAGPEADRALALQHLGRSLRSGTSAWEIAHGEAFADSLRRDPELADHLAHESGSLVYLQHGLVRVLRSLGTGDVVVVGPGARLVEDLARRHGLTTVRAGSVGDGAGGGGGRATVAVSAMLLGHLDDDAACAHLRGLADLAPRLVVIDASAPDGLSPAAAEEIALQFAVTAAAPRSPERVAELAAAGGWTSISHRGIGWGVVAAEFALAAGPGPAT